MNLYKSLVNAAQGCVRLHSTKCILLQSISLHFQDHLNYDVGLENTDIIVLVYDDIQVMRTLYLKTEQ